MSGGLQKGDFQEEAARSQKMVCYTHVWGWLSLPDVFPAIPPILQARPDIPESPFLCGVPPVPSVEKLHIMSTFKKVG